MNNTLSVGSFITFGWETFKKRGWFLVGATLLYIVLSVLASYVGGLFGGLLGTVIKLVFSMFIGMGWIAFFLKAHDSIATVTLSDFWHPKDFWKYVGTYILYIVIIMVGFVLLIIPGVIAMTVFIFAPYIAIDKSMKPIDALKESARITKGHRLLILALLLVTILLTLLGVVALVVGILVTVPITALATMHAYRMLDKNAAVANPTV